MSLRALKPEKTHTVEFIDDARGKTTRQMTGREWMSETELRLPSKGTSLLLRCTAEN